MIKKKNPKAVHYVNNEHMYLALVDYFAICDKVESQWNKKYGKQKQKLIKDGIPEKKIFDYLPNIPWPRVPEYLGKCMFDIATRSNNAPNFCGYTYKEEMVADGYEDCILRIRSFNIDQAMIKVYTKDEETGKYKLLFTVGTREGFIKQLKENGLKINHRRFEKTIKHKFSEEVEFKDCKVKITRNPFGYFTTACYYASVRRIKKEKKQKHVKSEMIKNSGVLADMESATQTGDNKQYDNSYLNFLQETVDQDKPATKKQKNVLKKTTKAHQRKLRLLEEEAEKERERQERSLDTRENDSRLFDEDDDLDFNNDEE